MCDLGRRVVVLWLAWGSGREWGRDKVSGRGVACAGWAAIRSHVHHSLSWLRLGMVAGTGVCACQLHWCSYREAATLEAGICLVLRLPGSSALRGSLDSLLGQRARIPRGRGHVRLPSPCAAFMWYTILLANPRTEQGLWTMGYGL